jgi:2-oxoglutarate dehydrogenase E2 component (dihydrolipoamide succinyltransferase)
MADLVVPQLGESITEAVVARWLKRVGEPVAADEPVVDLETDKVTVQLPSPVAGALAEQRFAVGATVKVGDIVGQVAGTGAVVGASASSVAPAADRERLLKLPPSQRALARERGAAAPGISPPAAVEGSASAPRGSGSRMLDPRDEVVPMSPLRKRIAERLVQAQQETASLTTFNEVDMSAVMELRARHKEAFEATHGVKLGFMSFFVKACVAACKQFPGLNAEVGDSAIIYKKHYDLGIAVSAPRGLVVPVLRNCDALSFAAIERGIAELATRAKDGTLALDELTGGTFTITNGGIYGSMMSTPLLNLPQTGILGMHNIVRRPVAVGDEVQIRPMMYVALTYDHRVVDGREAVSFLVAVKERLESPSRMLVEV